MLAPPCQPSKYFCHEFLSSGTANREAVNSQIPSPVAEGIVKSHSAGVISVCSDLVTSFMLGQRFCCLWIFISILILQMEHQQVLAESAQAGLSHPFLSHFPASKSSLCPFPSQWCVFQDRPCSSPHIPFQAACSLTSPQNFSLSETQT